MSDSTLIPQGRPSGKVDLEEQCPVCGDKVSGYHYGVLTCESCKGFFKRTVQNNKTYVCVENQQCKIDTSKRKRCPFCRFQKCLNVGMRLEAVRADRMRGGRNKFGPMYKHNRALKQQKKALIQARRLRIESNQKEVTFTSNIHSIAILHNTKLNPNQLPSLSLSQPCNSPAVIQHQITYPSNWAMRLENCSNSADLASFAEAIVGLHHTSSRSISTQSPRIPQLEIEFLHCDPHELQLQKKIFSCLQQEQACRHREANTFSSVCVMADQLLCSIVEWARTSIFFKELKVSDQMRLLHSCWSELLVLEIISRQVLYGIDGGLLLITGQQFRERLITILMSADAFLVQGELSYVASHAGSALVSLNQRGTELVEKLRMLKVDHQEFACIRFLILFAPDFHRSPKSPKFSVFERGCTSLEKRDVKELEEHHFVESVQQQVEGALLKYTLASSSQSCNRFTCLQLYLSELHSLSILAEDYLYYKHLSGEVPCNNLLNEMLHAKCCWT